MRKLRTVTKNPVSIKHTCRFGHKIRRLKKRGKFNPTSNIKTQKQALTLKVKVDDQMNVAEQATLNAARGLLSREDVEKLAGLIHLRHNASALVRIGSPLTLS